MVLYSLYPFTDKTKFQHEIAYKVLDKMYFVYLSEDNDAVDILIGPRLPPYDYRAMTSRDYAYGTLKVPDVVQDYVKDQYPEYFI